MVGVTVVAFDVAPLLQINDEVHPVAVKVTDSPAQMLFVLAVIFTGLDAEVTEIITEPEEAHAADPQTAE